jgi:hypothetical protein
VAARVSALGNAELRATVLAVKALDKDIRKNIRTQTRSVAGREWTEALRSEAKTVQQSRMLVKTARVRVSDQNVMVTSASSKRRALSGGATPFQHGKAFEFGSHKGHGRQLPPVKRGGYVFYPAAAEMIPRLLSLWSQTTFRTVAEALEGGGHG